MNMNILLTSGGTRVDVWPDDLGSTFLNKNTRAYQPAKDIRIQKV